MPAKTSLRQCEEQGRTPRRADLSRRLETLLSYSAITLTSIVVFHLGLYGLASLYCMISQWKNIFRPLKSGAVLAIIYLKKSVYSLGGSLTTTPCGSAFEASFARSKTLSLPSQPPIRASALWPPSESMTVAAFYHLESVFGRKAALPLLAWLGRSFSVPRALMSICSRGSPVVDLQVSITYA